MATETYKSHYRGYEIDTLLDKVSDLTPDDYAKKTDISDFVTESEVDQKIEEAAYELPTATPDTLGGVKVDNTTVTIDEDGIIHSMNPDNNTIDFLTVKSIVSDFEADSYDFKEGDTHAGFVGFKPANAVVFNENNKKFTVIQYCNIITSVNRSKILTGMEVIKPSELCYPTNATAIEDATCAWKLNEDETKVYFRDINGVNVTETLSGFSKRYELYGFSSTTVRIEMIFDLVKSDKTLYTISTEITSITDYLYSNKNAINIRWDLASVIDAYINSLKFRALPKTDIPVDPKDFQSILKIKKIEGYECNFIEILSNIQYYNIENNIDISLKYDELDAYIHVQYVSDTSVDSIVPTYDFTYTSGKVRKYAVQEQNLLETIKQIYDMNEKETEFTNDGRIIERFGYYILETIFNGDNVTKVLTNNNTGKTITKVITFDSNGKIHEIVTEE